MYGRCRPGTSLDAQKVQAIWLDGAPPPSEHQQIVQTPQKPISELHLSTQSSASHTMASKSASRALRASLRQLKVPYVQQRSFITAVNVSSKSALLRPARKAVTSAIVQQTRGKKTVDFAGDKEVVYGTQCIMVPHANGSLLTRRTQSVTTGRVTSSWYVSSPPPEHASMRLTLAVGILQERHPRPHWVRFARARPGPEPPRQRPQCHRGCAEEWTELERCRTRWVGPG